MKFLRIAPVIVFLMLTTALFGQWQVVAPLLLSAAPAGGAMTYSDGRVWAGGLAKLYMSADTGATWSDRTPRFNISGAYREIAFYDRNSGIVAVNGKTQPFITRDGGLSWSAMIGLPATLFASCTFIANDQEIAVCGTASPSNIATISVSRDGGVNWLTTDFPQYDYIQQLKVGTGNILYALAVTQNSKSRIIYSTDYGVTWIETLGTFDYDCYSFALDPCDTNAIYVTDEELFNSTDKISEFFFSTDRGTTWQRRFQTQGKNINGSLAITQGANLYMQTVTNGMVRSTDLGSTWSYIGGPDGVGDSRMIAVIDENTILAADWRGNILRTTNSGGDSITSSLPKGFFLTSKDTMFLHDTVESCYGGGRDSVSYTFGGSCFLPSIKDLKIEGDEYGVESSTSNSATVTFSPKGLGLRKGTLVITFIDGSTRRIPLAGTAISKGYNVGISPDSLFQQDSLFGCQTIDRVAHITISGCPTPRIAWQKIIGVASADYSIQQTAPDSLLGDDMVTLRFSPKGSGRRDADYHVKLADSTDLIIHLVGFGFPTLPLEIKNGATQFTTDTIGGLVSIPIIISGIDKPQTVEMNIYFDNTLDYIGSTSLSGAKIDVGLPGLTSSHIRIPASDMVVNGISAYANFNVFADSNVTSHVRFDSVQVLGMQYPCQYLTDTRTSVEVINLLLPDCGITSISKFAHHGIIPQFILYPNPTTGSFMLTSSAAIGAVNITITDALGSVQLSEWSEFSTLRHRMIDLSSLPSGMFFIRITSANGSASLPVVLKK